MLHDLLRTYDFSVQLWVPVMLHESFKGFATTIQQMFDLFLTRAQLIPYDSLERLKNLVVRIRARLVLHDSLNDLNAQRIL